MASNKSSKRSYPKYREWLFILYPESIPTDFKERLESLGRPIAISPLHCKDLSERKFDDLSLDEQALVGKGNPIYKKPHYHCIYVAANPVTSESVRNKIKRALGNQALSHMEVCDNIEGSYLYLTHESKDAIAKNKTVYDKKDIVLLNDFDIDRYVHLDETQKRELKNNLLDLIRREHLVNIGDLMGYLELYGAEIGITNMSDVNDIVCSSPSAFRLWFESSYQNGWRARYVDRINPETGEMIIVNPGR